MSSPFSRVGPPLDDLEQGAAAVDRAGEADGADRGVGDQVGAGLQAVHDAERAVGRAGLAGGGVQDVEDQLRGRRVRAVRLDDDGAAGGQRRGGVAAGHGEGEREVAGPEDRDRADRDEHPAQVRARAHRGLPGGVDRGLEVAALVEHLGEQPQLVAGAGQLAVQPGGAQCGLPVGDGDHVVPPGLQAVGEGAQQRRPAGAAEGVQGGGRGERGRAEPVRLLRSGLLGDHLDGLAGAGVGADDPAVGGCGHGCLLCGGAGVSGWRRR